MVSCLNYSMVIVRQNIMTKDATHFTLARKLRKLEEGPEDKA